MPVLNVAFPIATTSAQVYFVVPPRIRGDYKCRPK